MRGAYGGVQAVAYRGGQRRQFAPGGTLRRAAQKEKRKKKRKEKKGKRGRKKKEEREKMKIWKKRVITVKLKWNI